MTASHTAIRGRSVLTLRHHDPDGIAAVLATAARLKADRDWPSALAGRVIALIFEKPSTRTRVSFESGIARLGGDSLVLSGRDMQMGRGETIEDTARVLSRMVDAIVIRTGPHATIAELDRAADVPVINALTYDHHPCQALADAQTLAERFGDLAGLPVAWVGDGNNVCTSLMIVAGLTGLRLTCGCPEGYEPDGEVMAWADGAARDRGGSVTGARDPAAAVADARAIYTDTWVSMGDEQAAAQRRAALEPYRVDDALLDAAGPDAVLMHCLPAHHGEEVTRDLLHGPRSAVWDQAENRMHAQAALLAHILGGSRP